VFYLGGSFDRFSMDLSRIIPNIRPRPALMGRKINLIVSWLEPFSERMFRLALKPPMLPMEGWNLSWPLPEAITCLVDWARTFIGKRG